LYGYLVGYRRAGIRPKRDAITPATERVCETSQSEGKLGNQPPLDVISSADKRTQLPIALASEDANGIAAVRVAASP
jgi:hypothetical protein